MTRKVKSPQDFFDLMDNIGEGKFVTIGYVAAANVNVPKIQRRNPLTNRMKGYPDYSVFEGGEEIGALVKLGVYNIRYTHTNAIEKRYHDYYKPSVNAIRAEYGLEPTQDRPSTSTSTLQYGNGIKQNVNLGKTYHPQNVYNARKKSSVIYAINTDGHIIRALRDSEVGPYLSKKGVSGVEALKKIGMEEGKIQEFVNRIKALKFEYRSFQDDCILWLAGTVKGEKIIYINSSITRAVDGININPHDFLAIANDRYKKEMASLDLQESYDRLDHIVGRVIKESVARLTNRSRLIREYDEHMLDGVDSIDARSINMFIKEMIPFGNRFSKNSPYKPIRQLVLFFSEDGARKHGTRLTKDIVNNILKNEAVAKAVGELSNHDKEITSYIYGEKKLSGKPLMQRIIWELDGILECLMKLNQVYNQTNSSNWFSHTDAIKGREDKKMVGLAQIMTKAVMAATKIREQIKKMQELLDKPRDPFTYRMRGI